MFWTMTWLRGPRLIFHSTNLAPDDTSGVVVVESGVGEVVVVAAAGEVVAVGAVEVVVAFGDASSPPPHAAPRRASPGKMSNVSQSDLQEVVASALNTLQ